MRSFSTVSAQAAPLPLDNVDTDQIIPASFLKGLDRDGLVEGLFHGWRVLENGDLNPDFVLHKPEHKDARILLVGDNFGCGSSREHAPWALQAWGFEVVIGKGFAEIFLNNAHRNGLLTVSLPSDRVDTLLALIEANPSATIDVNLETQRISFPDGSGGKFDIDPFARHCILNGLDPLDHLLNQIPNIEVFENRHTPRIQLHSPGTERGMP